MRGGIEGMARGSRVLLAWSSGKDSAWTLNELRVAGAEVVGLLTTFNGAAERVAMHAVRRDLVEWQAAATGLPLVAVDLPWPCSNQDYERAMEQALGEARRDLGITHVAFGDLFLEDIRNYREERMAGTGLTPLFPLWGDGADTPALARDMMAGGIEAVLTCVDPGHLDPEFVGRAWDADLLAELPPGVDPCGENGEFHTFCFGGPVFAGALAVKVGERVCRDGFWFADLMKR